jgi:hypothetical protein
LAILTDNVYKNGQTEAGMNPVHGEGGLRRTWQVLRAPGWEVLSFPVRDMRGGEEPGRVLQLLYREVFSDG